MNMDPRVRYVTQASAYDRLLDNGPLTDRKIAAYQKKGHYGRAPVKTRTRVVPSLDKRYKL